MSQNKNQIIMVGDSGVGKTSLIRKYIYQKNGVHTPTIGADIQFVDINILNNQGTVLSSNKLVIWDTAGQERFHSCPDQYFQQAEGVLVVYDITNYQSFLSCAEWINKVTLHSINENVQFILVGNKIDENEKRTVTTSMGLDFARNRGMDFIEISAQEGINIDEVFSEMAKKLFIRTLDVNKKPVTNLGYTELSKTGSFKLQHDEKNKITRSGCRC